MNIIEAVRDPLLLGSAIKDATTFQSWFAVLKAIFGLPLSEDDANLYRSCTGRSELPERPFGTVWLIIGRRGGKSLVMALVATYMALFKDWRPFLSPGERAVILLVAADREQAKILRRYIGAILATPIFAQQVQGQTADTIELNGDVVIEVATCSYRTVRGRSVCVALLDEASFWRTETSANPDREVWRAIRPSMATFGSSALAVVASSPYARRGLMWESFKKFFGKPDATNLVWQAGTKVMNPTIDDEFLAGEFEADPASAEAEYNANFRTDIESYVSREVVDAAVVSGRYELPPASGISYAAFVDPSGGSADSMTLAIAHRNNDGGLVLDAVRERKPPFSPDDVVLEFAALLKTYRVRTISGDRYGGEWPRERFRIVGIAYDLSNRSKSDLYRDMLPLLNSGKVELLDHPRLVSQLCGLERRTARGGEIPSTTRPASTTTSPMLLPEQCLRWMPNAGFSSLAMKCWRGRHDRRDIHGHRHTQTDHFHPTDGNHLGARGAIK
jgi:hypothetical protein